MCIPQQPENQFNVDLQTELSAAELAELSAEELEDLARDIVYDIADLQDSDYLALLEYDYVAEIGWCRSEEELDRKLEDLADQVRFDSSFELVQVTGLVYTFELVYS